MFTELCCVIICCFFVVCVSFAWLRVFADVLICVCCVIYCFDVDVLHVCLPLPIYINVVFYYVVRLLCVLVCVCVVLCIC